MFYFKQFNERRTKRRLPGEVRKQMERSMEQGPYRELDGTEETNEQVLKSLLILFKRIIYP